MDDYQWNELLKDSTVAPVLNTVELCDEVIAADWSNSLCQLYAKKLEPINL